jgi:rubredoxin
MDARDMRGTIAAATHALRYECGVCWQVYDPAAGDPFWQVPPGTPFSDLPAHWSCPVCAAERDRFLELKDE